MSRLLVTVVAALALALAPAAVAAELRASLPDIEDEVMCLQCGTALNVSTAPVAERQRDFIRRRIAQGQTKEQIKQALVAEFGPAVLAVPEDDGFSIAAWLVPALLVAGGIAGVLLTARRWRHAGDSGAVPAPRLSPDDERRLDAELAAFDR
jgi:cytochrome c-type biogenesis protein CcmH